MILQHVALPFYTLETLNLFLQVLVLGGNSCTADAMRDRGPKAKRGPAFNHYADGSFGSAVSLG